MLDRWKNLTNVQKLSATVLIYNALGLARELKIRGDLSDPIFQLVIAGDLLFIGYCLGRRVDQVIKIVDERPIG